MKRASVGAAGLLALSVALAWPAADRVAAVESSGAAAASPSAAQATLNLPDKIQFNRDVRPILSDNCYFCHGFDAAKRKADLRLDTKEGLLAKLDDGPPVVPGKPDESQIVKRITSKDPDEVMPPADHPKRLTAREMAVLRKWIEQGGEVEGHWAYLPPKRPAVPQVDPAAKHPIDQFIRQRLKAEGLTPSAEADRVTLLRRVTFDLTGLPPTADEVSAFISDTSPGAYERVVDRLLASPRYGERMAMYWLDLVRYADTIGYHSDNPMNVSPYREWVVHAFNANKPFDQFTVEQLAGDLLPSPTTEQRVASGYNRLLQTTEEGGAQAKEYLVKNLTDRVRNYSTVWLGATVGCAQCHDHKFDPIAAKDFYTMGAFFADVQEAPIGRREPGMPVPTPTQAEQIKKLDDGIAAAKGKLDVPTPELTAGQAAWEKQIADGGLKVDWQPVEITVLATKKGAGTQLKKEADGVVRAVAPKAGFPAEDAYTVTVKLPATGVTALRLEVLADDAFPAKGPGVSPNGNFVLSEVKAELVDTTKDRKSGRSPLKFARASADYDQPSFPAAHAVDGKPATGWGVMPEFGKPHAAVFEFDKPVVAASGDTVAVTFEFASKYPQHQFGKFRVSATTSPAPAGENSIPPAVRKALKVAADHRSADQKAEVAKYYRSIAPALQPVREEIAAFEKQKAELLKTVPTSLVSTSGPPRTVKVLARGDWQDETGPEVQPAIPEVLGKLPITGRRATRLDLARWTIDPANPLTSRVFVNRAWKLFFGQGLSKVLDDLGFQGEWPTHPELLDWLAVEFQSPAGGGPAWDVKRLVRLLVTTETYLQGSVATAAMKETDPYNRLYARQSPFRLDAETVRDNALAVSGLLVEKVGGPSVFPYQPKGYWFALNFPTREWQNDAGDGLYRRGLYTHWQRSFLHPSLVAFDAPSREEATCERARSNIPQQALVLLNDPTYVEAARVLASRMLKHGDAVDDAGRVRWGFGQVTSRPPTGDEMAVLADLLAKHRAEYKREAESAKSLLAVGEAKNAMDLDPSELAAWTSVARVLLNLSETITRY